ncbi:MAG: restriction endonuclease subunit S [Alcaligenaceae bacterium]|nr:MAG: restriction endonuclease subunit S [Alcaligenaceae bacterium]
MSAVRLGSLLMDVQAGFATGESLEHGGVLQVRMNNVEIDGSWNWDGKRRVPVTAKQLERCRLLANDVLFNATNSPELVGKSALYTEVGEDVVFSNHFLRLRVDPARLAPNFLAHWLRSQWRQGLFKALCNAWVNQASVRKETLLDLAIRLPSLREQQYIASILDKADTLHRKRQESIRLTGDFLRAAFYELFGDPVANGKEWPERAIFEVGTVTTGNTPSRDVAAYFGDAIEWIKSDNINTPSHWLTKAREGLSELGATVARTAPTGSTLMTCIAGSPACIGNVAMSDRTVAFNQQINAVTPIAGVEPEFLYALLLFSKSRIQAKATSSMKGMVSKGVLEKVRLIWPPVEMQMKFVKLFKKANQVRLDMEEADGSPLITVLQDKLFT